MAERIVKHFGPATLEVIEQAHRSIRAQWRDSRLLWLPLQLALTEEQYDEQNEVDRLIERAVGRPFTDQNALTYLRSADIPLEIARTIFANASPRPYASSIRLSVCRLRGCPISQSLKDMFGQF